MFRKKITHKNYSECELISYSADERERERERERESRKQGREMSEIVLEIRKASSTELKVYRKLQ